MIQKSDLLKIVLVLIAIYLFMKFSNREGLDNVSPVPVVSPPVVSPPVVSPPLVQPSATTVAQSVVTPVISAPVKPATTPGPATVPVVDQQSQINKVVNNQVPLSSADLLPKYNDANEFAQQNPVSNLLKEQNFLQAGYHIGINTVIQSNKLPYLDIRSCPPIPKQEVGPFNNSSYEQPAGSNRRYLEIGQ